MEKNPPSVAFILLGNYPDHAGEKKFFLSEGLYGGRGGFWDWLPTRRLSGNAVQGIGLLGLR